MLRYFLPFLLLVSPGLARELPGVADPINPVSGSILLCGKQGMTSEAARAFASLANDSPGRILVVTTDTSRVSRSVTLLKKLGQKVQLLELKNRAQAESADFHVPIRSATGIWLDDDFSKMGVGTRFETELKALAERGWVIGASGKAAESLGKRIVEGKASRHGFSILPGSAVLTDGDQGAKPEGDDESASLIHWEISPSAVMVVHEGRRVGVIGTEPVTARVKARNGWTERVERFDPPTPRLPYSTDLLAWSRSAKARSGPVFPPTHPPVPSVNKGTLIIIGGGGSTVDMWQRFIKKAGGKDAKFVCIVQGDNSSIPGRLKSLGCKKVTVLSSGLALRPKADADKSILKPLREADGIFFGGGRTFRFMEAYQQTQAHRLMFELLDRGGVIAGTSAGAQIQGDFLVRGDPRTNKTIWYPGNDTGLGFIKGVIIDVHFAERKRQLTLPNLLEKHPGMLGLGVDEATAIVVQGHTAEVLGRGSAWFYDNGNTRKSNTMKPVILKTGKRYDLKTGKPLSP